MKYLCICRLTILQVPVQAMINIPPANALNFHLNTTSTVIKTAQIIMQQIPHKR